MDLIHSEHGSYTLNFRKGEEVMEGLRAFFEKKDIAAAHISGVGAVGEVELAFYNTETKEYERKTFAEELEVVSLNGNVGVKEDGTLVVHVHGAFGRRDFSVIGGHVFSMIISGAGELHIASFSGAITRAPDEETGLTLMCPAA